MRRSEVVGLRRRDLVPDERKLQVLVTFTGSKTDQTKKGAVRFLRCIRSVECRSKNGSSLLCPYHTLRTLIEGNSTRFTRSSALIFSCKGKKAHRAATFASGIRRLLENAGYAVGKTNTGRWLYGGHSLRRGGAKGMISSGIAREYVQCFGRWSSCAVDCYIWEAMVEESCKSWTRALNQSFPMPSSMITPGLVRGEIRNSEIPLATEESIIRYLSQWGNLFLFTWDGKGKGKGEQR